MKPRTLVLLLAILAFFAKLYCAATTFGSSDAMTFLRFGEFIHRFGLIAMYRKTIEFNHTPLVGWFSQAAFVLSMNDLDTRLFNFYLRLPVILADLFAVLALLWLREKTGRPSWRVLGVFALSPVSFMVSGFHGNVDSLMVLGLLLAAIACAVERPALCGLFLGLSCNIKIVPVFLIPAFFFFWWPRGRALRFTLPAAATILVGWSYPLIMVPKVFLRHVFGYSSIWGLWGLTYGLRMTSLHAFQGIGFLNTSPAETVVAMVLKLLIVTAVLLVAWQRRKAEGLEIFKTLALSWSIFFVFAPGFGPQYLIWPAPFFILASESWYLALTVTSSAALFVFYNALAGNRLPWDRAFAFDTTLAQWTPWLVFPWLALAGFLLYSARLRLTMPSESSGSVPALAAPREAMNSMEASPLNLS